MLSFCTQTISNVPGSERCTLIQGELDQTTLDNPHPVRWDLVICHNVMHLFEPDKQISLLRLPGQCRADDGRLVFSGYSEPADEDTTQRMMAIGLQRLQNRGINPEQNKATRSSRNKVVFSVDSEQVSNVLADEVLHQLHCFTRGCSPNSGSAHGMGTPTLERMADDLLKQARPVMGNSQVTQHMTASPRFISARTSEGESRQA